MHFINIFLSHLLTPWKYDIFSHAFFIVLHNRSNNSLATDLYKISAQYIYEYVSTYVHNAERATIFVENNLQQANKKEKKNEEKNISAVHMPRT